MEEQTTFDKESLSEEQKNQNAEKKEIQIFNKHFYITPILILLNVVVFFIMVGSGVNIMDPDVDSLLAWGGNFKAFTLNGEWWRLLTSCFLHGGIIHLLMNMYALYYIGCLLEPRLGALKYTIAYLVCGVIASLASVFWNDLMVSVGASGAIFGLYGVFLALLTTNIIDKHTQKSLLTSIGLFVGYNLLFGLTKDGIDNAAHIGGLLSGLVVGYAFYLALMRPDNKKLGAIVCGSVLVGALFISASAYHLISNDVGLYDQRMDVFIENETKALEKYPLFEEYSDRQIYQELASKRKYWAENLDIAKEINEMNLPDELLLSNDQMTKYCQLRLEICDLAQKKLDEGLDKYDQEFYHASARLEALFDEIEKGNQ